MEQIMTFLVVRTTLNLGVIVVRAVTTLFILSIGVLLPWSILVIYSFLSYITNLLYNSSN